MDDGDVENSGEKDGGVDDNKRVASKRVAREHEVCDDGRPICHLYRGAYSGGMFDWARRIKQKASSRQFEGEKRTPRLIQDEQA